MKIGTIIETVYQSVTGGKPSVDSKVKRIDIRAYLPASINLAIKDEYLLELQLDKNASSLPTQLFATYEDVKVLYNVNRDLKYIELPVTPIMLKNDMGISMVTSMGGDDAFAPLIRQNQLSGYDKYLGKVTLFWIEGKKIFFKNISPFVDTVLIKCIASADELNDDDIAPIPSGLEAKVIDICVKYFMGMRGTPADDLQDNVDNQKGQ